MRRTRFTPGEYSARHKRRLVEREVEESKRRIREAMDDNSNCQSLKSDKSDENFIESNLIKHSPETCFIDAPSDLITKEGENCIAYPDDDAINIKAVVGKVEDESRDFVEEESPDIDEEAIYGLEELENEYRYSDLDDDDDDNDCDGDDVNDDKPKSKWLHILERMLDDSKKSNNENSNHVSYLQKIHTRKSESEIISEKLLSVLPRWKVANNIGTTAVTKFLHMIRKEIPLLKLPLDGRTIVKTPKCTATRVIGGGEYYHFGLTSCLEKIIAEQKKKGITNNKIDLLINVDGAPVGKSSNKDLWPILCSDKIAKKVFIVGVFYGESKPEDANEFLEYFVNDAIESVNNGLVVDDVDYKITVDGIICDAPAKAYILGIKYHSGYSSCTKCNIVGVFDKCICFPGGVGVLRTDEKFREYAYMKKEIGGEQNDEAEMSIDQDGYQVKETILTKIPKLGLVSQVPRDPMHLAFLGCVRKLIFLWKFSATHRRLPMRVLNKMSERLLAIRDHVPYEFARKPRDLKDIKNFKATEFRQIGLYTGVVAFKGHLSDAVYHNFVTFHVVISIYSNPLLAKDKEWVNYGGKLSQNFVKKYRKLYGKRYVSHNIHNFEHLADDVHRYGELENFSAFRFENAIAQLKRYIRSGNQPLQQLVRRCKEIEILQDIPVLSKEDTLKNNHYEGPLTSNFENVTQFKVGIFDSFKINCSDDKNNYVLIDGKFVVRILNLVFNHDDNETYCIGQKLQIIGPLYTSPCSSSVLGINVVNESLDAPFEYWSIKLFTSKLFKMPHKQHLVVFPILHTLRHVAEQNK